MKKDIAKTIAIALSMAFMFCMGSHMQKPVPIVINSIIGVLMVIFSVLARDKSRKESEE